MENNKTEETEKKSAEIKDFLVSVIGNAPIGIMTINMGEIITVCNQSLLGIFKKDISSEEAINQPISVFLEKVPSLLKAIDHAYLKGRQSFNMPMVSYEDRFLAIRARMIADGMLFFIDDITDNIAHSKEIDQISCMKDDFLNIAAHDLRTPMSVIRANTEMILGGDYGEIPAKFKIPLQDIDQSNLSLIKMVDDYLTIGRMEKGKITITPQPMDILPILNFHVEYIKPLAEKRGLRFDYIIPVKLPLVLVDSNKIPEVIANLLDNAIKYTDKGLINLKVSVNKDSIVVAVTDTGIGMAEGQQRTIFQKYAQIDGKKRVAHGKGTGLGLGLYISRLIVEGCGGKIWVESELDKGSTFYFSLPLAKTPKATNTNTNNH